MKNNSYDNEILNIIKIKNLIACRIEKCCIFVVSNLSDEKAYNK